MLTGPGTPATQEIAARDMQFFYNVMGNLPNPDPILKKAGKDITVYEGLLYDDQVGMCAEALELAIQAMPWEIDHNGATDNWATELRNMMASWDHERIFSEAINARLFGYQPIEACWTLNERLWNIADLVGKPPEWFHFDEQNLLRLRTKGSLIKGTPVGHQAMPYKFMVPRHKASYKNPYGKAVLALCFWPVAFKKGGIKFWLKLIEKYGIPFLVGKQPRGSSDKAANTLLDMLEHMVQDAVAVIPDDSSVEILGQGAGTASGDLFERHVRYHDASIAKAVLGQTLTSSSGDDGAGSYALGNVHLQVFGNVKLGTAKLIKKVYDQAFAWLTELNQGGPAPTFQWVLDEDVQKDRAERDKTLKETGLRFTKKYFQNRYNLDGDDFELAQENAQGPAPANFNMAKPDGCPCGCGRALHFQEQAGTGFPDQAAIDGATGNGWPQRHTEEWLELVTELLKNSTGFEEAMEKLAGLYPQMDTRHLEDRLANALFVAEAYGRLQAKEEAEGDD